MPHDFKHDFKGVIFDMDGLMLDTEPIYRQSMRQASAELGCNIDDQLHDRLIGRSLSDWRATLLQTFGKSYHSSAADAASSGSSTFRNSASHKKRA